MNIEEVKEIDFEDLGILYNAHLNKIAKKYINEYNFFYERICKKNSSNLFWWISSVASRNPHQSSHYLNFCKIKLLSEVIKNNKNLKIIYTSNVSFKKCINLLLIENNKKIKIISKEKYQKLFFLIQFFKFFLKNFKNLLLFQLINLLNKKLNKIPSQNIHIFEIFESNNFDGINRYYPNINNYISNKKNIFFYTDILIDNFKKYKLKIKKLRANGNNYLIKNNFIKISDLFIYIFKFFFKNKKIIYASTNKYFDELAMYELQNNFFSEMTFKSFLSYQAFKRLKIKGLNIKNFIDWWENQPLDKAVSFSIYNLFPDCKIIGNLGYIPRKNEFQLSPLDIEINLKAAPSLFLVSGIEVENIIKNFSRNIQCKVVPSLRYLDILKKYHNSTKIMEPSYEESEINILVGLTIYKPESFLILNYIKNFLKNTTKNVDIFIKCHPANIINVHQYFNFNKKIKIFNNFIFEKNFKFAITGMSTISYELLTFGIPIIICNETNNFNFLPDLDKVNNKFWRISSTQLEFNKSVDTFISRKNLDFYEKNNLSEFIKNNYFKHQNFDKIEIFYN